MGAASRAASCSIPRVAGRLSWWLVIAVSIGLGLAPGCAFVDPQTGDPLAVCVDADSDPTKTVSFKDQIRPIMKGLPFGPRPCGDCHVPGKGSQEGFDETGLNLGTLKTARAGGRRSQNATIIPGSPCRSVMVQKLRGTFDGARMPKGGPYWSAEQVQLLTDWIAEGAVGGDDE